MNLNPENVKKVWDKFKEGDTQTKMKKDKLCFYKSYWDSLTQEEREEWEKHVEVVVIGGVVVDDSDWAFIFKDRRESR